jgi:hypothetical protein
MVTGKVSSIVTLDFDGKEGRRWLAKLANLGLKPHRNTPSGGAHMDFVHPGWHVKTLNAKSDHALQKKYPGVDIRADGGYACVAGTYNGGAYTWLRDPMPYPLDKLPPDMREFFGLDKPLSPTPKPLIGSAAPPADVANNSSGDASDDEPLLYPWQRECRLRMRAKMAARGESNGRCGTDSDYWVDKALALAATDGRNNAGIWLAIQLRDAGLDRSEAEQIVAGDYAGRVGGVNQKGVTEAYSDAEARASVASAYSRPAREPARKTVLSGAGQTPEAEGEGGAERPVIYLSVPKLDAVIGKSIAALREAYQDKPRFFVQGHRMVHVVRDAKGRASIAEAGEVFLRPELERVADYVKKKDGHKAPAWPTLDLARGILARPPREWGLPELRGVVTGPVLRPDGTIVTKPGYDAALRLYYAPVRKLALPPIPDAPTQEDCRQAAQVIGEVIAEFPFVSKADRANYFALLLTPFLRHLVDNVPLALLDSPQQGTGKTLLALVLAWIYEGAEPNTWPAPSSQEKWEKDLTTILLGGRAITIFDNVGHTLHAPVLAKILTSSEHSDRMMRTHTEMRIPNTTLFVATGNNIRVGGDLARRCYRIRIDAKMARPWKRKGFRIPRLKAYVRKHRGELLAALLTMIRGWYAAGRPIPKTPKRDKQGSPVVDKQGKPVVVSPGELGGGFEDWSRKVGRILAYAGIEGFLGNQERLYEELNPSENTWERFLRAAYAQYGSGGFTVAQLIADCDNGEFAKDALPDDPGFAAYRGDLDANKIGGAFTRNREKRFGAENFYLASEKRPGATVRWRVKNGDGKNPPPPIGKLRKGKFCGRKRTVWTRSK